MSLPFSVAVQVSDPPRGGGSQPVLDFAAQAWTLTTSWGSTPSTAYITYVSEVGNGGPILQGAFVRIQVARHIFFGICKRDTLTEGTDGRRRTMEFADLREFLARDAVFCAFNKADIRIVNGRRVKRYWHIYPADFSTGVKTFTDDALTAREIIEAMLGAPTVLSPWLNNVAPPIWHADQVDLPVFDVDCLSGRPLSSALQEVSDKQGLVFSLVATDVNPYQLVWVRKGEGFLPVYEGGKIFPKNSNHRRDGFALSEQPTKVVVVGDRNVYQVMNLTMQHDWSRAWEVFWDVDRFVEDIYQRASTEMAFGSIPAGTRYKDIVDDAANPAANEHIVGRQLAFARSRTITVREYAALRADNSFADHRLFAGRSRMDMPAALYIGQLVLRAFRPPSAVRTGPTTTVPTWSLNLIGRQVATVTHDPVTGEMTPDLTQPPDGNGYAVVKGYLVGSDIFRTINPERFDPVKWQTQQELWQVTPFQIDNSGEDGGYIVFDTPVIKSADVVRQIKGYAVLHAKPTLQVPEVRASLCFEAERFQWYEGNGDRTAVETVANLEGEFVVSAQTGLGFEVPYADGQMATHKASVIGQSLLAAGAVYREGGFVRYIQPDDPPVLLMSMYDRVTIKFGTDGLYEDVDFTTERARANFIPERELDRRSRERELLPGQAELREQAHQAKLVAMGVRVNPKLAKTMAEALHGPVGQTAELQPHVIKPGQEKPAESDWEDGKIPVGVPGWKKPADPAATKKPGQQVVFAGHADADWSGPPGEEVNACGDYFDFAGVTVRDGEDLNGPIQLQRTGRGLARVWQMASDFGQGDLPAGTVLYGSPNSEALYGFPFAELQPPDGTVYKRIPAVAVLLAEVKGVPLNAVLPGNDGRSWVLAPVMFTAVSNRGEVIEARVIRVGRLLLECEDALTGETILVARPPYLSMADLDGGFNVQEAVVGQPDQGRMRGYTANYPYLIMSPLRRKVNWGGGTEWSAVPPSETEVVWPPYEEGTSTILVSRLTDNLTPFAVAQKNGEGEWDLDTSATSFPASGEVQPVVWMDLNVQGRQWLRERGTYVSPANV